MGQVRTTPKTTANAQENPIRFESMAVGSVSVKSFAVVLGVVLTCPITYKHT